MIESSKVCLQKLDIFPIKVRIFEFQEWRCSTIYIFRHLFFNFLSDTITGSRGKRGGSGMGWGGGNFSSEFERESRIVSVAALKNTYTSFLIRVDRNRKYINACTEIFYINSYIYKHDIILYIFSQKRR